jgi:hypothetical protein
MTLKVFIQTKNIKLTILNLNFIINNFGILLDDNNNYINIDDGEKKLFI